MAMELIVRLLKHFQLLASKWEMERDWIDSVIDECQHRNDLQQSKEWENNPQILFDETLYNLSKSMEPNP